MPSDDRDQQLDRALERHLRGASTDPACPDAEILAAYHERSLSHEEMAHWKTHIASCSRCQETLALLEQTDSVVANNWDEQEVPAALTGAKDIRKEDSAPQRLAAGAAAVPFSVPSAAKAVVKTRRRVPWRIVVPAGALAASLLVWVAVHENAQFARHGRFSVQVAENHEALHPELKTIPKSKEAEARDEGSAALQSYSPKERVPAATATTPGPVGKPIPATGMVAPAPAPQELAKSEQNNLARLDKNNSANEFRAKDAEGIVGGRRTGSAAPAAPKVAAGRAGGPLIPNQAQNQMQNQNAYQNSNQVVTPPAKQPLGQASEKVTVEAEKQPVTEDKKNVRKEITQTNETVSAGAVTETVEVTSAAPTLTTDSLAKASVNGKAVIASSLQGVSIIFSPDRKHLWRIGPGGSIEYSTDMGKTWNKQMSGMTVDLLSGSAPTKRVCWIAGRKGVLLLTTDGGKHWKQIASPISGDIGGINAADAQNASVWDTSNHNRFQTRDGGVTWEQIANQ